MSYSTQTTPYFNQKVSLAKMSQSRPTVQFVEIAENKQDHRNHISWQEENNQAMGDHSKKQNGVKQPRRRIFDKFESKLDQK